jgi:hypothetical protein
MPCWGALLLLDAKRIVEARTIARSCLENFYWTVGLTEEGEVFVRKMRDDEMSHRRAQGQSIFSNDIEFLEERVKQRLQAFMRDSGSQFGDAKTLSPKQVTHQGRLPEDLHFLWSSLGGRASIGDDTQPLRGAGCCRRDRWHQRGPGR